VGGHRRKSNRSDPAGIADIVGFDNRTAKFIAIEVKGPTGRTSKEQAEFLAVVASAGGIGIVANSVEDVIVRLR